MLIMPAVDIKNGKCVQLVQGKPGSEQVVINNPENVAKLWEDKGASIIHVIDLDGTIEGKSNLPIIKDVLDNVNVPIQLGGGIRSVEYAEKLLNLGVERLIIGTMGIKEPETITYLASEFGKEHIMVSLDSKDSRVVINGWQNSIDKSAVELGSEFEELGAGSILFTNVDYEGLLEGFSLEPVNNLLNSVNIPVVYSGGISSIEDVAKLSKTNVEGVVIGSALYKENIKLEDALKYQKID